MRDINDTIAAVSSASLTSGIIGKSIIRISGPEAIALVKSIHKSKATFDCPAEKRFLKPLTLEITNSIATEACVYIFRSPNSYTGQDLVEIHLFASECIIELLFAKILQNARLAEAGEFTLRAYLNGKIDLSQAEAVAAIVSGSNNFQLGAAEKLLAGSLCENISQVRKEMIELMSSIEAGMDFSDEDIEFISQQQACAKAESLICILESILRSSVRYEEMIDMVSIGLAGVANVGKSSLINKLLGTDRSIVADEMGTTRDVLTGVLELENTRCAIFDCAGIKQNCKNLLDSLANQAAINSLKNAGLVLMCIDAARFNVAEAEQLLTLINNYNVMFVLTKCDIVEQELISKQVHQLEEITNHMTSRSAHSTDDSQSFDDKERETISVQTDNYRDVILPVSAKTGFGIEELKKQIENTIVSIQSGSSEAADKIAINHRHKQLIEAAIDTIKEAKNSLAVSSNEIAVMLIRQAYISLGSVQNEHVDEKVLDKIFSQFCIGK